jgi:hypothetical protein
VFERGDNDQADLLTVLQRLKLTGEFKVTFMAKSARHEDGTVEHHYPFQACDFLVYEVGKASRTMLDHDSVQGRLIEHVQSRQSLRRLLPIGREMTQRFIDTGLLTEFCRSFRVRRRPQRVS